MHSDITAIIADAAAGHALSAERLTRVIESPETTLMGVLAAAGAAKTIGGARPFTCGIVNAKSGLCQENCTFCAQSGSHAAAVPIHSLITEKDMLARAERLAEAGVDFMGMVTSGTRPGVGDFTRLCSMASQIRARFPLKLCASLGLLGYEQASRLADAGFTSYHHNLETARSHYPSVCTSHTYDLRTQTVRNAKKAGLRVCAGGIFGVGESWRQRLELAEELGQLDVDSIPINFLTPIAGTPLASTPRPSPRDALLIIALFRLMHPRRDIVVCGGRVALGRYEPLLFPAGANGLMVGDYLTTTGAALSSDLDMLTTLEIRDA